MSVGVTLQQTQCESLCNQPMSKKREKRKEKRKERERRASHTTLGIASHDYTSLQTQSKKANRRIKKARAGGNPWTKKVTMHAMHISHFYMNTLGMAG